MPSLSFQKHFVPGILSMLDKDYGRRNKVKPKTTTIRAMRKSPFRKGDKLFLFSGLRTKQCRRLGETVCLKVEQIEMLDCGGETYMVVVDNRLIGYNEVLKIARADGFADGMGMMQWFRKNHGLPFTGQRIHMSNTYDRKYYLHKVAKDLDLKIKLTKMEKTIEVSQEETEKVKTSKHLNELMTDYQYGVQIINPLFK